MSLREKKGAQKRSLERLSDSEVECTQNVIYGRCCHLGLVESVNDHLTLPLSFAPSLTQGYQHIRTYDINSANSNPVVSYEGHTKNVTALGFHEDGLWMYSGGEDFSARIWDSRQENPSLPFCCFFFTF